MQSKWAGVLPQPHLDLAGGIALWRPDHRKKVSGAFGVATRNDAAVASSIL
jgi:hypothetical protein